MHAIIKPLAPVLHVSREQSRHAVTIHFTCVARCTCRTVTVEKWRAVGSGSDSKHPLSCHSRARGSAGSLGPFSLPEFRLMKSVYAGKCQSRLALITVLWQVHTHRYTHKHTHTHTHTNNNNTTTQKQSTNKQTKKTNKRTLKIL